MHFSPNRLTITNFRGVVGELVIDFTRLKPGLYFVQGRNEVEPRLGSNGASKSTLFVDALYWALTGKTSGSNRPAAGIENRNAGKDTTSVKFDFSLDGQNYSVERTRKPNQLAIDGEIVVQSSVDALLPITDSALRRSIILDQFGEMFLSLGPEDKSRIFSDTLNLGVWLNASDKAGAECKQIQVEIANTENDLAKVQGSLEETKQLLAQSAKQEEEFESKIQIAVAEKRLELKTAVGVARNARQELDDARAANVGYGDVKLEVRLNDLKSVFKQRQAALNTTNSDISKVESEVGRLNTQLSLYSSENKVCPECGQRVSTKHIEDKQALLVKSLESCKGVLGVLYDGSKHATASLVKLEQEIEELEKSLVYYHEALSRVAVCAERSLSADKQVQQLKKDIEELKERANPYTEQCDKLETRRDTLVHQRKSLRSDLGHYNKRLEIYKFWQQGFKEIRLEQIDSCLLELEIASTRHAEELGLDGWELGFTVEKETKAGNISHGFSVLLYPPEQRDPVPFDTYSGGETQRLQHAVTFGLSEVLLGRAGISTDFEVLDEPTVHLSPEGIDDLLVCLKDRAEALNRRIFLIDQIGRDRGAFDGVITVVRRRDGVVLEDDGLLSPSRVRERL